MSWSSACCSSHISYLRVFHSLPLQQMRKTLGTWSFLESAGIDPTTSRMISERSTMWSNCLAAACKVLRSDRANCLGFLMITHHVLTRPRATLHDEVAEWLRRWTANPLCSARVGSNPILVAPESFLTCRLHMSATNHTLPHFQTVFLIWLKAGLCYVYWAECNLCR